MRAEFPPVSDGELLDREIERGRILATVGAHPRILVQGPDDSGVSEFSSWLISACAENRTVIYWDFERAPGVEGIDILRELSEKLPKATRFEAAYASVQLEFSNRPPITATQKVGERASAGRDQTIITELHVPSLADHLSRNLRRLAKAFFEDLQSCCVDDPVVLVFSGIRVGGERPIPSRDLFEVLISSMWRLAEQSLPEKLCIVISATVINPHDLRPLGKRVELPLGPIVFSEACAVLAQVIPGFSLPEATAAIQASIAPVVNGISYAELQQRVTCLLLNRVEPSGAGVWRR